MDELFTQFLIEARDLLPAAATALDLLRYTPDHRAHIDDAFRAVHTLKGSVALFDMAPVGQALHAAEDRLEGARSGKAMLDPASVSALLACIDRIDAWIDDMETLGQLPHDAGVEAMRLVRRLRDQTGTDEPDATRPPGNPDAWVRAILEREPDAFRSTPGDLVAFRYWPDEDCFFRGDDPLAIVATIPETIFLEIGFRNPPPGIDQFDPFRCDLRMEGLSAASLSDVQTALRRIGEQAEIRMVPRAREAQDRTDEGARTVRVDERRIDTLVDDVSELVVAGNRLAAIIAETGQIDAEIIQRLRAVQVDIDRGIQAMQRSVKAVRLVSVGPAVRRLPRLVRDIANTLGRDIAFLIEGEALHVDKAIADSLFEPLLHLVRNALDHGIEPPEHRLASGKPSKGTLRLRFARSGEQLHVTLSDDGAGIDPAQIRASAVTRGLITSEAASLLDDQGSIDLIFSPGFSTAQTVTDVSGRGVGMDAVRRSVENLGGRVEVESRHGAGTTMHIRLPLSAITTKLLTVLVGDEQYAIPFDRITMTTIVAASKIITISDSDALVIRDQVVPLLHLSDLIGKPDRRADPLRLVVTTFGSEEVALAVSGFGDRLESVVKPASGLLASLPGIAGTTVMGNGEILLVLHPERLIG